VKLNGEIKESVKDKIAKSLVSQDFLQAYLGWLSLCCVSTRVAMIHPTERNSASAVRSLLLMKRSKKSRLVACNCSRATNKLATHFNRRREALAELANVKHYRKKEKARLRNDTCETVCALLTPGHHSPASTVIATSKPTQLI